MNCIIKRVITCCAAGFALVLSFSTKANAEEMEPVSTDNVSASMVPAVPATQPVSAQSETTDSGSVSQETAGPAPAQTAFGDDIQWNAASVTDTADEQAEEPETEAQLHDTQMPEQKSAGTFSEQAVPMPVSGEAAALSAPVPGTGDPNPTALLSPEESETTPASASVSVGNTTLGENGDDSGWNSQSGSGWRYDAASGSVTLVGCTTVDITASNTGVNLNVAGMNHIGTLYADGDVSITGTGIVLIDRIDMLEGTQLNLLTDIARYENGSAALFLRQDDGSYLLINGSVAGVLDESYTLPENVTLVVPDGSKLDMRVTHTVTKRTERYDLRTDSYSETEEIFLDVQTLLNVDYEETITGGKETETDNERIIHNTNIDFSIPQLTVPENSIFRIEQGGLLNMQSYSFRQNYYANFAQNMSLLRVNGILELDGRITADAPIGSAGLARIELGENATASGDGTISDGIVYVKTKKEASVNLVKKSTAAIYSGAGEKLNLNIIGKDVAVTFEDNARLNRVSGPEESCVTFYGVELENRIDILDGISCDFRFGSGYIYENGNLVNEVFPDAKNRTAQHTGDNLNRIEVQTLPSEKRISFGADFYNTPIPSFVYCISTQMLEGSAIAWELEMKELPDEVHWNDLFAPDEHGYLDIFYCDPVTGRITAKQITSNGEAANITNAFLIRLVDVEARGNSGGGGSLTSTNTGNTGSGVLGGQNAGTLQGAKPLSILSGSRTNTPPSGSDTGSGDTGNTNTEGNNTENNGTGNSGTGNSDTGNSNTGEENGEDVENQPIPSNPGMDDISDTKAKAAEDAENVVITVTGEAGHFTVRVFYDQVELQSLGGGSVPVSVRWAVPAQWSRSDLFAVFKKPDGSLVAFRIAFAPDGTLCFDTSLLGDFTIVCFKWPGELFTEVFYTALRDLL